MDGRSRLDRYQNLRSGMSRNDNTDSARTPSQAFDNTDSFNSLNRSFQRTVPTPSRQTSDYESMLKEHEDFLKSLDEQFDNMHRNNYSQSVIQNNTQTAHTDSTNLNPATANQYTNAAQQPNTNSYNPYASNSYGGGNYNMASYDQPQQNFAPNYGNVQQPYNFNQAYQQPQPNYAPNYGYPQQSYTPDAANAAPVNPYAADTQTNTFTSAPQSQQNAYTAPVEQPQPNYVPNYGYPQQSYTPDEANAAPINPYAADTQANTFTSAPQSQQNAYTAPAAQTTHSNTAEEIMQQNSIKQIIDNQRFAIPDVKQVQPQTLNMFTAPENKVTSAFAADAPVEKKQPEETYTNQYAQNLYSNAQTAFATAAFESVGNKIEIQPEQPVFNNPFAIKSEEPESVSVPSYNIFAEQPKPVETPAYSTPAEQPKPVETPAYTAESGQDANTVETVESAEAKTPEISVVVDDDIYPYAAQQTTEIEQPKPVETPAYSAPAEQPKPIETPAYSAPVEQPKPVEEIKPVETSEDNLSTRDDFSIDDISSFVGEISDNPVPVKEEETVMEQTGAYDDFDSYINDVLSGFETPEQKESTQDNVPSFEDVKPAEEIKPIEETNAVEETKHDADSKTETVPEEPAKDERVSIEDKIPGIFFVDDQDDSINSIKQEISGWEFKEDEFSIGEPDGNLQPQPQPKEEIKPSATLEAPIFYDDPKNIGDLTSKLNKEKELNDELLEKTRALDYKVSEYQNEVEDANKENSKLSRILNLILTLLILMLFVILFVIGFWFVNERGLSL